MALRLNNINQPLIDAYYFRQAQTATVARYFYEDGINIFRPELDIFGTGPEKHLIHEAGVYQATVAALSQVFGYSVQLARAVSIFSGIVSGLCVYCLVHEISNKKILALLSLFFFWFFPMNIFFQRAVLIESFVLMLHMLALCFWLTVLRKHSITIFIITLVITTLAIIAKVTYGPFLLLFMLLIGAHEKGKQLFRTPITWIFIITVSGAALYWQEMANKLNILSHQELFTSSNPTHWYYNIGTLRERFMPKIWQVRVQNALGGVTKIGFLTSGLGGVFLMIKKNKTKSLWLGWGVIMLVYYFVFFRMQDHAYYFLIITPVLAVLSAYGVWGIFSLLKKVNQGIALFVVLTLVGFFMFKGVKNAQGYFVLHNDVQRKIDLMNKYFVKDGPIVFVAPLWKWESVYTYYTGRKGIVYRFDDLDIQEMKYLAQTYKYVVFQDFSAQDIDQELLSKFNLSEVHRDEGIVIAEFFL